MRATIWLRSLAAAVALVSCQSSGVNPTGLYGTQVRCTEGPRQTLDCRGTLQQYSRDFALQVGYLQRATVSVGATSTKLVEADALAGDLVQHYYRTCTLYNACLISRDDYVARTQKLQEIQLSVRQTLLAAGYGSQQNIQINPLGGAAPPGPLSAAPPGLGGTPGTPTATAPAQPRDTVDAILAILREGTRVFQQAGSTPASGSTPAAPAQPLRSPSQPGSTAPSPPAPVAPPGAGTPPLSPSQGKAQPDVQAALRGALVALREQAMREDPGLGSARAAVGNFTDADEPWSGPLGVALRREVANLIQTGVAFSPTPATVEGGVTAQQIRGLEKPNDPASLPALLGGELAIVGDYRIEPDLVIVRMRGVDAQAREVGQSTASIPRAAIPEVLLAPPANARETSRLIQSLDELGPRTNRDAKVEIVTNRPGQGASFRLGEEIRYFVKSTVDGYLHLFHVDADEKMLRIFPNRYQPNARIAAGQILEVPAPGAPFRFDASPPFGLETTFAIVTTTPLDERDVAALEGSFARPTPEAPGRVASRGILVAPAAAAASSTPPSGSTADKKSEPVIWNHVTVLIRP